MAISWLMGTNIWDIDLIFSYLAATWMKKSFIPSRT